ncbi:MAG TPA: hypothetical protein VJX91_06935 [Candidatus Eisenbacteria bacterium]|nr:hypothetical protein [Candidatus Eisenbacteria bacterium]
MSAPEVDERDVQRILRRDYPEHVDEVRKAILGLSVIEKTRVVLACLKLGSGQIEKLRYQIHEAPGYYRDILGHAETPGYMKRWSRWERLSAEERQSIEEEDRRQYEEWLRR